MSVQLKPDVACSFVVQSCSVGQKNSQSVASVPDNMTNDDLVAYM